MAYDLVVKNGTVVDGTGLPRYRRDIGIKDGRIVEMGRLDPDGARVIDADGKIVAPGFVDIHTHYDAQILWDPLLTCSPWHGTTTAVMGNCGFTLAPCLPHDRDYIAGMFAKVEGMSLKTLEAGIDWDWQSFPEYLDRISREQLGIDVGAMVGHSALRRFTMGEAGNEREATEDEIVRMEGLVREAMASGAFGFTTSMAPTHYGWHGEPVPSRLASEAEVLALGSVLREFKTGSIEIITPTAVRGDDHFLEQDQNLLTELSLRSGRPINFNEVSHAWDRPLAWREQLEYMERAAQQGAQVYGVARYQRLDSMLNLQSASGFEFWPTWRDVLLEPQEKKLALLRDPQVRSKLREEAERLDKEKPVWRQLPSMGFVRSTTGKYREYEGMNLAEISGKTGKAPAEILIDFSADEELQAEFAYTGVRSGDPEAVAEIIRSPHTLAGISDAGAHTDRISGSSYSTHLLAHWVRDRGEVSLEHAIRELSFIPAHLYGFRDRGTLVEGQKADVVVFDLDELEWMPTERFHDFPGGESRLGNTAKGYEYLVVGGEIVQESGRDTGARPGRLVRSTEFTRNGAA
jgi:N-acyl-D-amino-acid deacylase